MKTKSLNSILKISIGLLLGSVSLSAANTLDGKSIMDTKCVACHTGNTGDGLSRISEQRKTAEGWYMTLSRMQQHNGLSLTKEEEQSVIKYLADTQGLNYEESKPFRYVLENMPNYQESYNDPLFVDMCARCHTSARVGLQRRTSNEWYNLVNFHLGKFPTLEYQALSRDRDWFKIAKEKMVPYLTENFGYDKEFVLQTVDFNGEWSLFGQKLGDGDFTAKMTINETSKDKYKVTLDGTFVDGRTFTSSGEAIVYSGYEFRASLAINGVSYKQVFAVNPKTLELSGSMFQTIHPEEFSSINGIKSSDSKTSVLGVSPKAIKAGTTKLLIISGNNLDKTISLSKGLKLNKIIEKSSNKLVLEVTASSNYSSKQIDIEVGSTKFEDKLTVYKKVDSLKVFPSYAIARIGDGGGAMPKQHAIFEAVGYLAGTDGKIGTSDDISLGKVDARWSVAPFDERADVDGDVKFSGTMDSFSGRFTPSFAGPNPKRRFGTNNAGNLKVIATYKDGAHTLKADSHMIVTVQKWVNPPIN